VLERRAIACMGSPKEKQAPVSRAMAASERGIYGG